MTEGDRGGKALTYSSYLKVDELLELQKPESKEHDEILFIIIHQVYELWFKQINHEVAHLQASLDSVTDPADPEDDKLGDCLHDLVRILKILKTLVGQLDVLETMSPISFNSFRNRLESASGFQSAQFRELEFRLGHKQLDQLKNHPPGSRGRDSLDALVEAPSLWDSLLRYLKKKGYRIPDQLLQRNPTEPPPEDPDVRAALIEIYKSNDHLLKIFCERLVDLDEGLQEWRYRHVKMVERTIGHKPGTGGSPGAPYLRRTLFKPLFPDLWNIRTEL